MSNIDAPLTQEDGAVDANTAFFDLYSDRGRPYDANDEDLHPAVPADNPVWGETSWWSFHSPDDKLIGWIYMMARRGMGVMSLGVLMWDNTYEVNEARDLLYSKWSHHIPLSTDDKLSSLRKQVGGMKLELDVVEPLKQYAIRYRDGDELNLDIKFRGVTEVIGHGINDITGVGHGDQAMWCVGNLSLYGRPIYIEGPGFRDRSWSERAELPTAVGPCITDFAGNRDDFAFSVATVFDENLNPGAHLGFVMMDGKTAHAIDIGREYVRDSNGSAKIVKLKVLDDAGRTLEAIGERISAASFPVWTGLTCWISDIRWNAMERTVYGEDHLGCPTCLWRKMRLEGHPFVS